MTLHHVTMTSEARQPTNVSPAHPCGFVLPFPLPEPFPWPVFPTPFPFPLGPVPELLLPFWFPFPAPVLPCPLPWPAVPLPVLLLPFDSPFNVNGVLGTAAPPAVPPACAGSVFVSRPRTFPSLLSMRLNDVTCPAG